MLDLWLAMNRFHKSPFLSILIFIHYFEILAGELLTPYFCRFPSDSSAALFCDPAMAPAMKRPAAVQPEDAKAKAANGDSNEVVRWLHREAKESFRFPISTMNLESTSIYIVPMD